VKTIEDIRDEDEIETDPEILAELEEKRQLVDLIQNYGMTSEEAIAFYAKKH